MERNTYLTCKESLSRLRTFYIVILILRYHEIIHKEDWIWETYQKLESLHPGLGHNNPGGGASHLRNQSPKADSLSARSRIQYRGKWLWHGLRPVILLYHFLLRTRRLENHPSLWISEFTWIIVLFQQYAIVFTNYTNIFILSKKFNRY